MKSDVKAAAHAFLQLYNRSDSDVQQVHGRMPEDDREIIMSNIGFAERLFPQSGLMICPLSHPKLTYVSAGCEKVLGHPEHSLANLNVVNYFENIHDDDIAAVKQCFEFMGECGNLIPDLHRYAIHFRFRTANGTYRHIRNEHVAIRTRGSNYLFMMLFYNITDVEKFHQVSLQVFRNIKGNFTKIHDYHPRQSRQENSMTPRQHDVARLITRGFSNQEIADQLNVSIHTVKNHKRVLFKKENVRSSIELVSRERRAYLSQA